MQKGGWLRRGCLHEEPRQPQLLRERSISGKVKSTNSAIGFKFECITLLQKLENAREVECWSYVSKTIKRSWSKSVISLLRIGVLLRLGLAFIRHSIISIAIELFGYIGILFGYSDVHMRIQIVIRTIRMLNTFVYNTSRLLPVSR